MNSRPAWHHLTLGELADAGITFRTAYLPGQRVKIHGIRIRTYEPSTILESTVPNTDVPEACGRLALQLLQGGPL